MQWHFSNGEKWSIILFKSGILLLLSKKWRKNQKNQFNHFTRILNFYTKSCYNWNFLRRLTKRLTKDKINSRKRNQSINPPKNPEKTANIICTGNMSWKPVEQNSANYQLNELVKQQNKFQRKYAIIYSNHYRDEYNIMNSQTARNLIRAG